ncbi:nitroreductase family protein [Acinetobacter bouvetii]|uniref:Nitroreductase family protein n=1 Tax=Acinetobacter bouvetii TaxID=202951 RepID=A0A811GDK5_9GAMM|nr:nitroreductase family protein [Acinetobacter bouvetii]CAB1220496.1 Nitroreductase family protein [Acinetobacter bouvetii]
MSLNTIKKYVKKNLKKIDGFLVDISVKSFLLSNLYYLLRFKFSWEHRAVLAGKKRYNESLKNPSTNTSLLRRNVHRLEKGLLMQPRRVPFGLDYIEDTVYAYERAVQSDSEIRELTWARDVISEYMLITPMHPKIEPLRNIVKNTNKKLNIFSKEEKSIPYKRSLINAPDISYDQMLNLVKYRRSVRWFLPKKVDRSIIEKAVCIASYSPTACNRQPYEFRIFDDQALVSELIKLPMGSGGFGHQVTNLAVVVGKLRNYFDERDRHLIYIDGSLAIMSFIYALEVQGISSCCLNWPEVPELEKKMSDFLKLEADERPIMLIAFGYADMEGMVANSMKKPIELLVKYNFDGHMK